jgi:hypothetical protein
MTPSLVLGFALGVLPLPEAPRKPEDRVNRWLAQMPRSQSAGIDDFHRKHLERTRRSQAFRKEHIDWMEKMLDENIVRYTDESLRQQRREIASWRVDWEFGQRRLEVLEWWDQQRKRKAGATTDDEALARLQAIQDEWSAWGRGVEFGPKPREKK